MRISRGIGFWAILMSGAIHAGAVWLLMPEPKPPEEARGMLAVGVSLVAGAGPDGGGEQVSVATAETVEPATAERVSPEQAPVQPPEAVDAAPPEAVPPPEIQIAEVAPLNEPPPPDAPQAAPEPEAVEIATTVEPEEVVAEAEPPPPIPRARPTPPPPPQVRRPQPPKVVKREPPPRPKPEPQREPVPPTPAWTAAAPAAAEGPPSENLAAASTSSVAAPGRTPGAAGSQHGREGTPAPVGLGGTATDYASRLRAWLERHKEYPRRAQLRRQEGTATLRFAIDDSGRVLWHQIQRSSGYDLLDEAVEEAIDRAQPLPVPPPHIQREFVIPMIFNLR